MITTSWNMNICFHLACKCCSIATRKKRGREIILQGKYGRRARWGWRSWWWYLWAIRKVSLGFDHALRHSLVKCGKMITVPSQSLLGKQKVVFGNFSLHRENDYGILINAEATYKKGSPGVAANNKNHTKKENAKDQEIKEKHKQCLQWQSCVFVVLSSSIRFFVPYDFFFTAGLKLKAGFYTFIFCDFPFMIVDTNNSAWTAFSCMHTKACSNMIRNLKTSSSRKLFPHRLFVCRI